MGVPIQRVSQAHRQIRLHVPERIQSMVVSSAFHRERATWRTRGSWRKTGWNHSFHSQGRQRKKQLIQNGHLICSSKAADREVSQKQTLSRNRAKREGRLAWRSMGQNTIEAWARKAATRQNN